jgi:hypothetical protein
MLETYQMRSGRYLVKPVTFSAFIAVVAQLGL